jgi:hypothetical protein
MKGTGEGAPSMPSSWRIKGVHSCVLGALGALALVMAGACSFTESSWATACPNETLRLDEVYASRLPDCRAYEQISPTEKNLADARGAPDDVQSAPEGESVTFYSIIPFPGVVGSSEFPLYLSTRINTIGNEGWSTYGLVPPSPAGDGSTVIGSTEDISATVVASQEPLAPGGTPNAYNYYVRNNVTGEYALLAPGPAGRVSLADATPGGQRILFEDSTQLLPGAVGGDVPNLYEWDEGRLSLVGVLPDKHAPAGGASAGPGECEPELCWGHGGAGGGFYTPNTISQDGSRVVFTDDETGKLYIREPDVERTVEVSKGAADWRATTANGSKTFYVEDGRLYRFDLENEAPEEEITVGAAPDVVGVLGISASGSYAYFVANAVLTTGNNAEGHSPTLGADNLYMWHEGATQLTFITKLGGIGAPEEWRGACACNGLGDASGEKSSRASSTGTKLLFASTENLTGYEHSGQFELYLYDATSQKLICVSCNPAGIPAAKSAYLLNEPAVVAPSVPTVSLPRNLSEDGERVFFETEEALLPRDVNGQMNVYEWEHEGDGSCTEGSGDGSGGCLYLISTGVSPSGSYFGDASANGDNAFFFTRQSLVNQDQDYNSDLYDARVGGGIESQNKVPVAPCTNEEVCRGTPPPSPQFGTPTSAVFSGAENFIPQPEPTAAAKPKTKKKKAKPKKKKRHKPKTSVSRHTRRRGT